jgi:hypothetical protein
MHCPNFIMFGQWEFFADKKLISIIKSEFVKPEDHFCQFDNKM